MHLESLWTTLPDVTKSCRKRQSDADVKKDARKDSVPVQRQAYAVPAPMTVILHKYSSFNGCILYYFLRK